MRGFDFSSWHGIVTSIAALLLVTLIGMGIRLVMMMTLQQRRERQNRQINERLKALIAAYKTLGGSFTGTLTVDPAHRRDLKQALGPVAPATDTGTTPDAAPAEDHAPAMEPGDPLERSDRARRIRDAVEAALSDVVLFGTPAQVALAAAAMRDMAAGRPVHVSELVVSLRGYVREVLDLGPVPPGVTIPRQGPARPSGAGGGRGQREAGGRGGGGGGGMGGMGGGMAMGAGLGVTAASPDETDPQAGR